MIRTTILPALCFALFVASAASANNRGAARPNFVFFLVDDLGWGDVGFNGSTFYETPHVDALAASGAVFPNAYAACPVCSPTRASILTGRYPARVDVTDWLKGMEEANIKDRRVVTPQDRDALALEEVTIAEQLRQHDYQTCFIGKWHLGEEGFYPEDQGFEVNVGGYLKGSPPGGYYAPFNNPMLPDQADDKYLTDRLTDEAEKFLRQRNSASPFFLFFSYYNVHTPIQPNEVHVAHYQEKARRLRGETPFRIEHTAKTRMRQDNPAFASMVAAMDASVGRVLAELDRLDLADNTVVIFCSDNGGLSTHRQYGPTSNLHLRAGKGWLYEGGVRVPLVVRAPGVSRAGSIVETPVISTDFFPTMLELAELPQQPELHADGVNLVPLLRDESIAERTLYWHYPHYHGSQWMPGASILDRGWKLIEHYHWNKVELFNLVADPSETHDVSLANPTKTEELLGRLHVWQQEINAKLPVPLAATR